MIIMICPYCGYGIPLDQEHEEQFTGYIRCEACLKIVPIGRIINT
jgi:uncharacterized protein YbaR (Trm112 family)